MGMRIRHHLLLLAVFTTRTLQAGDLELKPETLKCWDEYVHKASVMMEQRSHGGGEFLWVAGNADRMARVRAGEVVVWPVSDTNPKRVPSGLIHDWVGAAFIPSARITDVLSVVRDYSRYKEVYKPGVLDAKLLRQTGGDDHFSMLLRNGTFFTKTALDSEYNSSYIQLDETRWYSVSCMTRVQEIENYGQLEQHKLPPDQGHGYLWRMCSLSQLQERDGGVYVDEELLALSRDLPMAMRWMAGPIIRRVARETVAASIGRTRVAVVLKADSTRMAAKKQGGCDASLAASKGCGCMGTIGCVR